MSKILSVALIVACSLSTSPAIAADACIELIRHAVYDQVAGFSEASSYREASEKLCKSSETTKSDTKKADTGGAYGPYSGYGNFEDNQSSAFREAMCDSTFSLEKFNSTRQLFTKTLNPSALNVVDHCISAANQGLRFTVDYPDEDTMLVSIVFLAPPGDRSQYREINSPLHIPPGLSCTGTLAQAKKGTHVTINSSDMTCSRIAPFTMFRLGDRQFTHNGGTVVVSTSVGPLTALMPKQPDPNYVPPVVAQPIEIGGQWMFRGVPTPRYAQVATVPGTNKLTFTNERGGVSQGVRTNEVTTEAFEWGHITAEIRDGGQILIWSNGTWWSRAAFDKIGGQKSDRPLDDTWRYTGRQCTVTGSGQSLTFINEKGEPSAGKLLDPTTVQAWGMKGKLIGDRAAMLWSNGTVWVR
jgi:hypothetical protein